MTDSMRDRPGRLVPLLACLAAVTMASGCAGGVPTTAPGSAVPSDQPTATATVTETEAAGSPATTSSPSGIAVSTCTLAELRVGLKTPDGGGAAGSRYVRLTFANTGGRSCTIAGYPGVSWVGQGDGTQIGAAAKRSGQKLVRHTLAPKETTSAVLRIVSAGAYGDDCRQTPTDGFRVYPPESRTSAFLRYPGTGCADTKVTTLEISPVAAS